MSTTIFVATDASHGRELWRTDGTASGTVLISDLKPGTASGLVTPSGGFEYPLYSAVGNVFFAYDDGVHGTELWATDGSSAGTRLVKDLHAGSAATSFGGIFTFGNKLLFSADIGDGKGAELYVSDGTPDGTGLVADLNPSRGSDPSGFTAYDGKVYFTADRPNNFNGSTGRSNGGTGAELFVTDGTAGGTHLVVNLASGQDTATIGPMNAVGGKLMLSYRDNVSAANASGDYHFAVSDGTAGGTTTFTPTTATGGKLGLYGARAVVGNQLYFDAHDVATNTDQLWITDGTAGGTHLVDAAHAIDSSQSGLATPLGDKLIFRSYDPATGYELFVADSSGAHLVKDLYTGTRLSGDGRTVIPNSSDPTLLGSKGGLVYFTATDGAHGTELWSTDGTDAGTQLVQDYLPGGFSGVPRGATLINGTILFDGDDGLVGQELGASDGTAAGTGLVKDINAQLDHTINVTGPSLTFTPVRREVTGGLLFEAYTQSQGIEPWISDGTAAGTRQLPTNFDFGLGDSAITAFRSYGTGIAFVRNNALWVADDDHFTNAHRVSPTTIGASTSAGAIGTSLGATLFFDGYNTAAITSPPETGSVYVSDGSADGTHILRTSTGQALTGSLNALADRVLITPTRGLYASDGTNAGTTQIGVADDVYTYGGRIGAGIFYIEQSSATGLYSVAVTDGTALGTRTATALPFTAPIGSSFAVGSARVLLDDGHLYRTDGTAAGTYQLLPENPETFTLTRLPTPGENGTIYFDARTGSAPNGSLWVTDGTNEGTRLLNGTLGYAIDLKYANGQLYYTLTTPSGGVSLYAANADGTNQHLVSDAATFTGITVAAGKVFVTGSDAANGAELWSTDGTAAGTVRLTDTFINPSSTPTNFTRLISAGEFAVAAPSVALVRDTGLSPQDAVTNDPALTITPAVSGGQLSYIVDGLAVASYNPASLGQGAHSITVTQTDEAGQVSAPGTISFNLDTVAPNNRIDTPPGSTVAGIPTAIEGHGAAEDAGGRLNIVEGGTLLATTTVASSGAWSTTVQLAQGDHHLTAVLTDVAGNTGFATIDITASAPPDNPVPSSGGGNPIDPGTPGSPTNPSGPDTTAPSLTLSAVSGAANHEAGHTLTGSIDAADAGLSVTIREGANVLGNAVSDTQGRFSFAFTDTKDGPAHDYVLTASATDAAGNTGTSDTFVFAFDYAPNRDLFGTVAHDASSHLGQVYALYEGLLNRAPEEAGAHAWVDGLDQGLTLHGVVQSFLDGTEAKGRINAADNADFVEQLYQTVLGRASDAPGKAAWVDGLEHGLTRASVAEGFVFGSEHQSNLKSGYVAGVYLSDPTDTAVARLYYGLLGRAPDAPGSAAWETGARDGLSLTEIAQSFLDGTEYNALHGSQTDAQFVNALYQGALGRAPELSGGQQWVDGLAHGLTRAGVAAAISEGPEAQAHLLGHIEQGWHLA